jgi:hypothetical protein
MSVKRYEWSENFRVKADPQAAGKAIERLGKRLGRDIEGISAADLVAEAAKPESPLHELFTWDDSEAARLHRESEARLVLRSIRVVVVSSGAEQTFIGRVAVRTEDSGAGRVYVPMSLAARNESLRNQMIDAAITGLKGWQERYRQLSGAAEALDHIDQAVASLVEAKRKAAKPMQVAV